MQRPAYRSRWLEGPLSSRNSRGKVRLILGARQTGKSSLLRQVAATDALFINLQDPRERQRYERARRGFVVCRCPRPVRLTDRVTAIPWQAV